MLLFLMTTEAIREQQTEKQTAVGHGCLSTNIYAGDSEAYVIARIYSPI